MTPTQGQERDRIKASIADKLFRKVVTPKRRKVGNEEFVEVKPDLSHDIYSHSYKVMGDAKTIQLSVRRTGRTDGSDLQIEIAITVERDNRHRGKKDFRRTEHASFSLPAEIAADFIKSCTEVVP